jgi:hypothetical protein
MAVEDLGWRVVGITPEALELLASVGFRKSQLPRRLCRGHIVDRVQTARILFDRANPIVEEEFFEVFLRNDRTIIMLSEQNRGKGRLPKYLPFENDNALLFPNGALIAWKHRKPEVEFLASLYAEYRDGHIAPIDCGP